MEERARKKASIELESEEPELCAFAKCFVARLAMEKKETGTGPAENGGPFKCGELNFLFKPSFPFSSKMAQGAGIEGGVGCTGVVSRKL